MSSNLTLNGPLQLFEGYNIAPAGANTDVMDSIVVPPRIFTIRVQITIGSSSKVSITVSDGSNTSTEHLNADVALPANTSLRQDVSVVPGATINIQCVSGSITINRLTLIGIQAELS